MKNKKKQTVAAAMVTAMGVTAVISPMGNIYAEQSDIATTQQTETTEVKTPAPPVTLPQNLTADAGQTLQDIVLPDGWTWIDSTTIISKEQTEYPARITVDDTAYDYSNVEGYNTEDHYVEYRLAVTVNEKEPAVIQDPQVTIPSTEIKQNLLSTPKADDLEINSTNFPNDEFRNYVINELAGGKTSLTKEEIANIKTIYVYGKKNIDDLTGIEHFTALTTLNCSDTGITKLDVSENTALEVLSCGSTGISGIINVSKNTALISLTCNNTGITNLDISKNTALIFLTCSNTGITNLDISKNTALMSLDCSNTGITSLDVSKNTTLTKLTCGNTGITSLDVSKNTALTSLNCNNTGITILDVSNSINLKDLNCYNTRITSLDVSKNTALTTLNCSNCPLVLLNIGKKEKLQYYQLPAPTTISTNTTADSFDIKDVVKGIDTQNVTLKSKGSYDKSTGIISNYDKSQPIQYEYDCGTAGGNPIKITVNMDVAIDIDALHFPDDTFRQYISDHYDTSNPKDNKLSASEINSITAIDLSAYADRKSIKSLQGIEYFTMLGTLNCRETSIDELDISKNKYLTKLDCYACRSLVNLNVEGATALNTLVCSGTSIRTLDVSQNKALETLECQDNGNLIDLTVNGADSLKNLYCYKTSINKLEVDKLSNLISIRCYETDIEELDVSKNQKLDSLECYDSKQLSSLILGKAELLGFLNCRDTIIDVLDVTGCPELRTLRCNDTKIEDLDLSQNTKLDELDCSNTNISSLNIENTPHNFVSLRYFGLSLAWANIGEKNVVNLFAPTTSSNITMKATGDSFNIKEKFKGIDTDKINITSNNAFDRESGVITLNNINDPVTYTYNCGKVNNNDVTLDVTLNFEKGDSTIGFNGSLDRVYTGKPVDLSSSINTTGSKAKPILTYKEKNGTNWNKLSQAPTNAGSYRLEVNLPEDEFCKAAIIEEEFIISKAEPQYDLPINLTAIFGQRLSDIKLPEGFSWENSAQSVGNAGDHKFMAVYTPKDTANYEVVKDIEVSVKVGKVKPIYQVPTNLSATYGQKLSDIKLPEGFSWENSAQNVGNVGDHKFKVNYTPKDTANYEIVNGIEVSVSVGKATPIYQAPTNLSATYGQKLSEIKLPEGFSWENSAQSVGNVGEHKFKVVYTPKDTMNYEVVNGIEVSVSVGKAKPIYKEPTNLSAIYGQKLGDIKLPEGFSWENSAQSVGNAGDHKFKVIYTPKDTANYEIVNGIEVSVKVGKVTPIYQVPTNINATYGQKLSEIKLPEGFSWENSTQSVGNAGDHKFKVVYTPKDTVNYEVVKDIEVSVKVGKATPTYQAPMNLSATYGQKLSEIKLPEGFSWEDSRQSVGNAGDHKFKAVYTPKDTANYEIVNGIEVSVTVGKVTPIYQAPANLSATYGQKLSDIKLPEGFSWEDSTQSVGNVGNHKFKVIYTPKDTANYEVVKDIEVSVKVGKARPIYQVPTNLSATYGQKLSDIKLSEGFSWENSAQSVGNAGDHKFKVVYTPKDTANYEIVKDIEVNVKVGKATPIYQVPTNLSATYGQKLSDIKLSEGFSWEDSVQSVGNAGDYKFKAVYTPKDTANYEVVKDIEVSVKVEKAMPVYQVPRNLKAVYGQRLSEIDLPEGFSWEDSTQSVGNVGDNEINIIYTPRDMKNYKTVLGINVTVVVTKATNEWNSDPVMEGWEYGEQAKTPTASASFGKAEIMYSDSVDGKFTEEVPSDAGIWYMKVTIAGTDNYEGLEKVVSFTIAPKRVDIHKDITIPDMSNEKDLEKLVVKDGDKVLVKGMDYDVVKKQVGNKVIVTITFKGNYTGTVEKSFMIKTAKPKEEAKAVEGVKTGDTSRTGMLATMSLLSAGCITILTGKNRRKGGKNK